MWRFKCVFKFCVLYSSESLMTLSHTPQRACISLSSKSSVKREAHHQGCHQLGQSKVRVSVFPQESTDLP
jgi:hypothetical protein